MRRLTWNNRRLNATVHSPQQRPEGAIRAGALKAVLMLSVAGAVPAPAQTLFQGRIDVTVQDPQDRSGPGRDGRDCRDLPRSSRPATPMARPTSSTSRPAPMSSPWTLQGFTTYRNETVRVTAGSSVPLKATLQVGWRERDGSGEPSKRRWSTRLARPSPPACCTRSCSRCPARAIPGSCSRPSPASSSIA